MAKLSLKANPTFSAKVGIPKHGSTPVEIQFTFKHRTSKDFSDWLKSLDGKDKAEAVLEMAEGWELEDEFSTDNIRVLLSNYMGAFQAILDTYMKELTQARLGN